jgi:molecular chaperone GrpE
MGVVECLIVSEENQQPGENTTQVPAADGAAVEGEMERLKAELVAAKDQVLRGQAEMQNVRRRAEQDVEKAHKFALDRFAGDIVTVADNLERALTTIDRHDDKQQPVAEGIELTLKSLLDTLQKHGVKQLNPMGEPFNPQEQEAIAMVPNPAMEPNSVMDVMQKGYTLNGRIVRPARVVVVKGN